MACKACSSFHWCPLTYWLRCMNDPTVVSPYYWLTRNVNPIFNFGELQGHLQRRNDQQIKGLSVQLLFGLSHVVSFISRLSILLPSRRHVVHAGGRLCWSEIQSSLIPLAKLIWWQSIPFFCIFDFSPSWDFLTEVTQRPILCQYDPKYIKANCHIYFGYKWPRPQMATCYSPATSLRFMGSINSCTHIKE